MSRAIVQVHKDGIIRQGSKLPGLRVNVLVNLAERRYSVRHLCCGRDAELTADQIRLRIRNGSHLCSECAVVVGGALSASIAASRRTA